MMTLILWLAASYLIGSIPTAYLFGRTLKGIDLRKHGSGNLGATNALRVLGKGIGITVLILDILKGFAVVAGAGLLLPRQEFSAAISNIFLCLSAVAVVCGHNWTIFLRFKGGKGIAATLGALIAFSLLIERFIWIVVCLVLAWIVIFLLSGFVSLGSIICSLSLPFFALYFNLAPELVFFLSVLAVFSLSRHKANLSRLLQRKEPRFHPLGFLKRK